MLKNLLTKKNVTAALVTIGLAVVAGVVAKSRKNVDNIVIEDIEAESTAPMVEDVAEEPIIKGKPVNRQPKQN